MSLITPAGCRARRLVNSHTSFHARASRPTSHAGTCVTSALSFVAVARPRYRLTASCTRTPDAASPSANLRMKVSGGQSTATISTVISGVALEPGRQCQELRHCIPVRRRRRLIHAGDKFFHFPARYQIVNLQPCRDQVMLQPRAGAGREELHLPIPADELLARHEPCELLRRALRQEPRVEVLLGE